MRRRPGELGRERGAVATRSELASSPVRFAPGRWRADVALSSTSADDCAFGLRQAGRWPAATSRSSTGHSGWLGHGALLLCGTSNKPFGELLRFIEAPELGECTRQDLSVPRTPKCSGVMHPKKRVMGGAELVLRFLELAESQEDGADDPSFARVDLGPGAALRLDPDRRRGRRSPRR